MSKTLILKIPDQLKEVLKKIAKQHDTTVAIIVRYALYQYIFNKKERLFDVDLHNLFGENANLFNHSLKKKDKKNIY